MTEETLTNIRKIKSLIRSNKYFNCNISSLCEEKLTMNYNTLRKYFKIKEGNTIGTYLQKYKLKLAKNELKNRDIKLSDFSKKLGFTEEYNFNRWFKDKTGKSPKQYRKLVFSSRLNRTNNI